VDEKRSARTDRTEVTALQERIGYQFRDPLLLEEALTHPSLGHETQRRHFDNQRLEFLGDAVLQLVVTEQLFRQFAGEAEGQLTKLRSRLVSRDALRRHAIALELGGFLMLGRGEEASGGRQRSSTLADAFEALIGAIYLDSDLETARHFILQQAAAELEQIKRQPTDVNPKGQLQELLQAISPSSPVYEVVAQSGPEHAKHFVVRAVWEGMSLGEGSGRSKKEAETAAAAEAMQQQRWKKRSDEIAASAD
jgi:ribonuclease III